ncbi:major centromere autoantigen B [Nephila pilipes]|uniref:Major centromere autoantigen B n=1 Tax=Nephila pilipes TaxID=299642 RepID=A0A8X6TD78_NEPPI|nr:major centromere autoantigen B [Nephila pilipes]
MKKRRKSSLAFKRDIIKKFEENSYSSKKAVAERFKIPESTLRGILKNLEAVTVANRDCGVHNAKSSRIQSGKHKELEKVLMQWLEETRALNIPANVWSLRVIKEI